MEMSIYERLNQDDVQYLGYFPADRGVFMLTLIGGQPPLVTVDTVPLRLAALSGARFVTLATLLTRADDPATVQDVPLFNPRAD